MVLEMLKDLETASGSGSFHALGHPSVVPSFSGKPRRDFCPQLNTRDLHSMPGIVFVDPSAPDETTATLVRNVHARNPTATRGEPMLSSTGRPEARFDETDKETHKLGNSQPEICRKRADREIFRLPRKRSILHNYMVGQPKNHISDLQFDKFRTLATDLPVLEDDVSQHRSVSWVLTDPSESMSWTERSRDG